MNVLVCLSENTTIALHGRQAAARFHWDELFCSPDEPIVGGCGCSCSPTSLLYICLWHQVKRR